jgi:hypothetical protein
MSNQSANGGKGYVQAFVDQRPKYDNTTKPKRKKKKNER